MKKIKLILPWTTLIAAPIMGASLVSCVNHINNIVVSASNEEEFYIGENNMYAGKIEFIDEIYVDKIKFNTDSIDKSYVSITNDKTGVEQKVKMAISVDRMKKNRYFASYVTPNVDDVTVNYSVVFHVNYLVDGNATEKSVDSEAKKNKDSHSWP